MSVTIYDIAKKAKVGIGTVSRVLNNHPNVSEPTRKRIFSIARKLQYRPHPVARALAGKGSNSILAFIPFFPTHFFSEVLQGVQSRLSDIDWELILYGVNHPDQLGTAFERHVLRTHVSGMLLFSMKVNKEFVKTSRNLKTPLVLVDAFHPSFDSITVDNKRGAYLATQHLIALGHKRIGLLNANPQSVPARERLDGYKEAMRDAGLTAHPELIKQSRSKVFDGFTRVTGAELMKEFIALKKNMPTAIFVASDTQALGALETLEENQLRCPEDIALVGFDDIELARYMGLTTVRQPMFMMGALAVEMFERRLKNLKGAPVHSQFTPDLVVRTSCGSSRERARSLDILRRA
ncbi:MAG: LacI family transcriptional regulator [Ignavibacteriae bacterium]|nr:LacI family transcriptional regulator [Ignavibacteriota bacterium]